MQMQGSLSTMWLAVFTFLSLLVLSFQEHILILTNGNSHTHGQLVLGKRLREMGHSIVVATHILNEEKLENALVKLGVQDDFSTIIYQSESDEDLEAIRALKTNTKVPSGWEFISMIFSSMLKMDRSTAGLLFDQRALSKLQEKTPDFMILDSVPIINGQFMLPLALGVRYGVWTSAPHSPMVPNLMPSWAPNMFGSFTDQMSFLERASNLFMSLSLQLFQNTVLRYSWNTYSNLTYPGEYGFQRKADIVLVDTDVAVDYAFPYPPKYVLTGGMHCRDAKPLTSELESFVQSATIGVIYVSLGSKFVELPPQLVTSISHLMNKLDGYKMIAVNTGSKISHSKVKEVSFAPQNDILGHPKTALFISHCGTNSQMEALYHNVLVLCIPGMIDQFHNAARIAAKGASLTLSLKTITGEELLAAISQMLTDPSFAAANSRISRLYRDQPLSPLERAAGWVDHVVKHGGDHLQFTGGDLWWWQYFLLDVWAFVLALLCAFISVMWFCCKRCCFCICSRRSKAKTE